MPIKAIIFDFGNVIAFFDYGRVLRRLSELSKPFITAQQVRNEIIDADLLTSFEKGKRSSEEFINQLQQRCHLEHVNQDQLIAIWNDLFTENTAVTSCLELIKPNVHLILGSTTNSIHFDYYRQKYAHVLDRFQEFILSYKVGHIKPAPEFYAACLAAASCQPEECYYIDDIPEYVQAAQSLGIDAITYHPDSNLEQELRSRGLLIGKL